MDKNTFGKGKLFEDFSNIMDNYNKNKLTHTKNNKYIKKINSFQKNISIIKKLNEVKIKKYLALLLYKDSLFLENSKEATYSNNVLHAIYYNFLKNKQNA